MRILQIPLGLDLFLTMAATLFLVSACKYLFLNGGRKSYSVLGFSINSISSVGSASAWQTRGRGLEPVLMRYIYSGKVHRISIFKF